MSITNRWKFPHSHFPEGIITIKNYTQKLQVHPPHNSIPFQYTHPHKLYMYTHTHTTKHYRIHTHPHTRTWNAPTHTHTYIQTHSYTRMHAFPPLHTHVYTPECTHPHTHTTILHHWLTLMGRSRWDWTHLAKVGYMTVSEVGRMAIGSASSDWPLFVTHATSGA